MSASGLPMDSQNQKTSQKAFLSKTNENKYVNQAVSKNRMCYILKAS